MEQAAKENKRADLNHVAESRGNDGLWPYTLTFEPIVHGDTAYFELQMRREEPRDVEANTV